MHIMFKCYQTGLLSKEGEKPFKVVVEKRERTYMSVTEPDKVASVGWEIQKEVLMTKVGHDLWLAKNGGA
jgi:hypothetical protein